MPPPDRTRSTPQPRIPKVSRLQRLEQAAPLTKLTMWRQFQSQQQSPPKSEANRVARELEARYGDALKAEALMTARAVAVFSCERHCEAVSGGN